MPHWKDHLDSKLLGAYSLFDDETEGWKEIDGLILRTAHEDHILGASGKQNIHVAHTNLGKPIKLNSTISEAIAAITGMKNPAKWVNVPVTFYVDTNVKFGKGKVEAIRVKARKHAPKVDYSAFEAMINECATLEQLGAVWTSTGFPQKELFNLKEAKKNELQKH